MNKDSKETGVTLIPNNETVALVIAAIQCGKDAARQERFEAPVEKSLEARFALLEYRQQEAA